MYFSELAAVFLAIEQESSRLKMTELLAGLFYKATSDEARVIAYLSLGEMRAPYHGTHFNVASKGMIGIVARVLGVHEEVVKKRADQEGDLGLVISAGLWRPEGALTVLQVYKALEEFEAVSGSGSVEEKMTRLAALLRLVDPLSARYIVRIVLQRLRLGFSEMTIIDALSWMVTGDKSARDAIENAYNVSADIGFIAKAVKEGGVKAIEAISITVGIPIRPAAAERLSSAAAIMEKVGEAFAQPKFDGFRLQVHLASGAHKRISFFSRNLLDMSSMFPDLLKALATLDVSSLVVEGEALAFDENTGAYLPFQETVKRKRKHDIDEMAVEFPLRLELFDILYLNGESLLEVPQFKRYEMLSKLMAQHSHPLLSVAEQITVSSPAQLEAYFLRTITAGLEGVMVKRKDAPYQPGKRNFNWIKLKRSERGRLDDTIDAVVLGYYFGEGKRAAFGIGAFLVGLFNKDEDRFETVAKIGTGLTDEGWVSFKSKCDDIKVKERPHNVVVAKELEPDVWTSPEFVVMLRADEITRSPLHSAGKTVNKPGYALRFPRFLGYRPDKSPNEATSVIEIEELFNEQGAVVMKS